MPPKIAVVPKKKAKKPVAVAAKKKAPVAAKKKAVSPAKKKAPKATPATWMRTKSKVMMPDGKKKTLYKHSVSGEMRVRKMVLRAGKKVASYLKAPRMMGGTPCSFYSDTGDRIEFRYGEDDSEAARAYNDSCPSILSTACQKAACSNKAHDGACVMDTEEIIDLGDCEVLGGGRHKKPMKTRK